MSCYRINIRGSFQALKIPVLGSVLFLVFITWFIYAAGNNGEWVDVFVRAYIGMIVPAVYLYIEYYSVSRGKAVIINPSNRTIDISGRTDRFDDIEVIDLFIAYSRRKWVGGLGLENYLYAKINMRDGRWYYMTCLLDSNLDGLMKNMAGVAVSVKKRFIPSIMLERLYTAFSRLE